MAGDSLVSDLGQGAGQELSFPQPRFFILYLSSCQIEIVIDAHKTC